MVYHIVVVFLAVVTVVIFAVVLLNVIANKQEYGRIDDSDRIFLVVAIALAVLAIANLLFHFGFLAWLP